MTPRSSGRTLGIVTVTVVLAGLMMPPLLVSQTLPAGVLEAEGAKRWAEAARRYREAIALEPERADLWKRLADVLAVLGETEEAAAAFERAARLSVKDAELYAQASAARAMLEQPEEASRLIEEALCLEPSRLDYLRRQADVKTWLGEYESASDAVSRLLEAEPRDPELLLESSRLLAWQDKLDEAADFARQSLAVDPSKTEAWLELARIESWRGDYAEALTLLEEYGTHGGEAWVEDSERMLYLAWADRPEAALALATPALEGVPDGARPRFLFGRAVALERSHRYDAMRSDLEALQEQDELNPGDVLELNRFLTTPLRSHLDVDAVGSRDRDGVEQLSGLFSLDLRLSDGDFLSFGASSLHTRAPKGSPLAPLEGQPRGAVASGWGGIDLTLSPHWSLEGRIGGARTIEHAALTYDATIGARVGDALRLSFRGRRGFLAVSPRTLSLGIVESGVHGGFSWAPDLAWRFDVAGERTALSDDNRRSRLSVGVRRLALRRAKWNLDLGWSGSWMGYRLDLDHGYYDPEIYYRQTFPASFYVKLSDDDGVSLVLAPGFQKDAKMSSIDIAGELACEATFGIYRGWQFVATFAAGLGASDYSRNYWRVSTGFFLVKRF